MDKLFMNSKKKDSNKGFELRFAKAEDTALILSFIKELAAYENLADEVIATEETLNESLFVRKSAEVILAEYAGEAVGFALFFHNFSTFVGKPGLYLEDLYVKPEIRGKGLGKMLLSFLAKLAIERDCGRLEWWCLDWNKSAIDFYKHIGAEPMEDWTVYRLSNDALSNLAKKY